MSYLVANPEDRFSRNEAHIVPYIPGGLFYFCNVVKSICPKGISGLFLLYFSINSCLQC